MKHTLIVNFKNYEAGLGPKAISLARAAEKIQQETGVNLVVAPPTPMLNAVASSVSVEVFAQKVENLPEGKSTGAVIPESIREAGCKGSLLNHSESRDTLKAITELVPRMTSLNLKTCICGETVSEAVKFAGLKPLYIALEPPELIGTGMAVSKAKPHLIQNFVRRLTDHKFRGAILCGAGIVSGADVAAAIRLGTDGILVSSSVMKSEEPGAKLLELARPLAR